MILPGEGRRRLTESSDDIICKIFKVHSDRAARNRCLAKAVDRCLHKNICQTKTAPCIADGKPVLRISAVLCIENCGFCAEYFLFSFDSLSRTSNAESIFEIPVAAATPATPMRSAITKNRLSPTFATPEKVSARNGYLLSPRARSTAEPKSQSRRNG